MVSVTQIIDQTVPYHEKIEKSKGKLHLHTKAPFVAGAWEKARRSNTETCSLKVGQILHVNSCYFMTIYGWHATNACIFIVVYQ